MRYGLFGIFFPFILCKVSWGLLILLCIHNITFKGIRAIGTYPNVSQVEIHTIGICIAFSLKMNYHKSDITMTVSHQSVEPLRDLLKTGKEYLVKIKELGKNNKVCL